jgi:hypothetical protein
MSGGVALRLAALLLAALLAGTGCATGGTSAKGSSAPASGAGSGTSAKGSSAPASGAGTAGSTPTDPGLNSALASLGLGSAAGPIASLIGAGMDYLHGLFSRPPTNEKGERGGARQQQIDADLEREVERHQREATVRPPVEQGVAIVRDHQAGQPPSGPGDRSPGQGVRILKDHLAPAPTSSRPAPRVDADGFVPIYAGSRLVRRERDIDGDGRPDVIVHYGADGRPVRREESSQLDGRFDTVTHYRDGRIARRESDTDGDGRPDLWTEYDAQERPARTEALLAPSRKVVQVYAEGRIAREEWRRLPEDRVERRLTYANGRVVEREEDSTGAGVLDVISIFDAQGRLMKQGRRTAEGRVAVWRYFAPDGGTVVREEELGTDGQVTAVAYYENGRLARRELYVLDDALLQRTLPAPRLTETPRDGNG